MGLVARRYASALFGVAGKNIETIAKDMDTVYQICEGSEDLVAVLKNPTIPPFAKQEIINKVFAKRVDPITEKFLSFIGAKNRLGLLKEISLEFSEIEKEDRGVLDAELHTAMAMDEKIKKSIVQAFEKRFNKKFNVVFQDDRSLLGGFRFLVKDRIYDYSLKDQLEDLRHRMVTFKPLT